MRFPFVKPLFYKMKIFSFFLTFMKTNVLNFHRKLLSVALVSLYTGQRHATYH